MSPMTFIGVFSTLFFPFKKAVLLWINLLSSVRSRVRRDDKKMCEQMWGQRNAF